jgi:circadian clock protein KaiB
MKISLRYRLPNVEFLKSAICMEAMMKQTTPKDSTKEFTRSLAKLKKEKYVLRLYVAGMTPKSTRAIMKIKEICQEYLQDRYDLEVIDIYQQPILAKGEQIIAAPTLIKKLPLPLRKFIGDMSNMEKILVGLDLRPKKKL